MKRINQIIPSDGKCDECGDIEELRPYGKGGAFICFECGMKNIDETKGQFDDLHKDADIVIGQPPKQLSGG